MNRGGAAAQIAKEMDNYQLDILGISESRWTGAGRMRLTSGQTVIYSGEQDHEKGVAIIISKQGMKSLMEWTPVNKRIITARFYSRFKKVTIIQVYAPHNERDDEEKNQFYQELQEVIDGCNKNDIIIAMGDLNARVGNDNSGYERTMGTHGYGTQNDNGERLCEFSQQNGLVIAGTLFPHKDIHKITWISPDGNTRSQLDHLMISGRWRSSLMDSRVQRGADSGSDHYLVRTRIKLRLSTHKNKKKTSPKFDVSQLKDEKIKMEFRTTLRKKLQKNRIEEDNKDNIEEIWDKQRDAYVKTAEEVLGHHKGRSKPWIQERSWKLINERKEIKIRIENTKSERIKSIRKEEYKEKDRQMKLSVREDKRQWTQEKAEMAEKAAENGRSKELYGIVKQLTGQGMRQVAAGKSKAGEPLKNKKARQERWKEHFQEVLNRDAPENPPERGEERREELEIPTDPPSLQEIQEAVKALKNRKAPGVDQITAEMLKADVEVTSKKLKDLFEIIWEKEEVPTQWNKGLICKIPKKGNLQECRNWRGITLLTQVSKVLSKILISRIQKGVDDSLRKEQAGFRTGRGTVNQIFILRNILEQVNEWNATMHTHFVDFEKAFDSIHRDSLWIIMQQFGIPLKLVKMVKTLYKDFQCAVIDANETTDWFPVTTGVKQGCCMSGFLFLLAIDWVMRKTVEGTRTGIRWNFTTMLEDLDFADDIALLSSTMNHLQQKTATLETNAGKVGLKLNEQKCKVMKANSRRDENLQVGGNDVEEVESFTYLGANISRDGGGTADVKKRIALASAQMKRLTNIWKATGISKKTKTSLFKSLVMSVLLYGCETWKLTNGEEKKLDTFQSKCLRRILKIRWQQHIRNETVFEMAGANRISDEVRRRRWNWIGHILRKDWNDDCAVALGWTPEGRRKRGRPKITWRRMIEKERNEAGWNTWTSVRQAAKDRQSWRNDVRALCDYWRKEH
jgi:endonuclease/exonuclease/phosphatase family metal-dependent hydrolase